MRVSVLLSMALTACGGAVAAAPSTATATATATPTATATATVTATPTPTATSTPTSTPTRGSVLVGDIISPKTFDPKPTVSALTVQLLSCYDQVRATNASLHGKLNLRVVVNEGGVVNSVEAESGGSANDPTLVACIAGAMKSVRFPKPGGTATVIVPLVFRQQPVSG